MIKVSRPIVYSVVGAVALYAVVLLTEPEKPAKKPTKKSTLGTSSKAPAGFLPEDMTAHFAPYKGKARDAFKPEILPKQAVINAVPNSGLALRGSWTLTGINTVDGKLSALIENSASGDSAFLGVGDRWNGLQVVAIEADTVVFLNALGQRSQLKFVDPNDETTVPPGGLPTLPGTLPTGPIPTRPGMPGMPGAPGGSNGVSVTNGGIAPVVPALPAPRSNGVSATIQLGGQERVNRL